MTPGDTLVITWLDSGYLVTTNTAQRVDGGKSQQSIGTANPHDVMAIVETAVLPFEECSQTPQDRSGEAIDENAT